MCSGIWRCKGGGGRAPGLLRNEWLREEVGVGLGFSEKMKMTGFKGSSSPTMYLNQSGAKVSFQFSSILR